MSKPIRVLLADDHAAVRSGVSAILSTSARIRVVAEAENGFDALAHAHRHMPDVALVDLRMPGTDGIWATERITAETATRVLVLTTFDGDDLVTDALAAGAHGYLLKTTGGADLIRAVEDIAQDRHVLDPVVAGTVIAGFAAAARTDAREGVSRRVGGATHLAANDLTGREREVLELVASGLSNQGIAEHLGISVTTVKTHVGALYAKSGAISRVLLAQVAADLR